MPRPFPSFQGWRVARVRPRVSEDVGRNEISAVTLAEDELMVLRLLSDGKHRSEIAQALGTTVRSVQRVRARLLDKLGARTDPHAAAIGFRRGILPLDRRQ